MGVKKYKREYLKLENRIQTNMSVEAMHEFLGHLLTKRIRGTINGTESAMPFSTPHGAILRQALSKYRKTKKPSGHAGYFYWLRLLLETNCVESISIQVKMRDPLEISQAVNVELPSGVIAEGVVTSKLSDYIYEVKLVHPQFGPQVAEIGLPFINPKS